MVLVHTYSEKLTSEIFQPVHTSRRFDLIQSSIHVVFLHISLLQNAGYSTFFKILVKKHPHHTLNTLIIAPVDFDAKLEEHIGHLETS